MTEFIMNAPGPDDILTSDGEWLENVQHAYIAQDHVYSGVEGAVVENVSVPEKDPLHHTMGLLLGHA